MSSKFKILYVDDEMDNLQVLRSAFKNDFQVSIFCSPHEALKEFSSNDYEILIADQRMPEMTGVEFLEQAHRIKPDPVRILLTGYSQLDAVVNAINRGKIFYYCTKPWKKDELQMVLVKAIEHYSIIQSNQSLIDNLSKSIRELETFLYRASHDLRAPISTQLGLLNLLRSEVTGNASIYISKIEEMIKRLENTLEKISQLSTSGYDYLHQNFLGNFEVVVDSCLDKFQAEILEHDIQIVKDIQDSEGFLLDYTSLSIVVSNLIENSIHFCRAEQPRQINIQSRIEPDQSVMTVTVEDNGLGIPANEHHLVFEPFFRGSHAKNGNGLGLYIVKKLCDLLHAGIQLESTVGNGTRFTLTIPNFKNRNNNNEL
jgi:two-component system sensor histidine kinase/response regulator